MKRKRIDENINTKIKEKEMEEDEKQNEGKKIREEGKM